MKKQRYCFLLSMIIYFSYVNASESDFAISSDDLYKLSESYEGLISDIIVELERCPSWMDITRREVDIRQSILRYYIRMTLYKTEELREAIKVYLLGSPYSISYELKNDSLLINKRSHFLHPELHKVLKVYALLRVLFDIPENIKITDEFDQIHASYLVYPEGNSDYPGQGGHALWPFIEEDGKLLFTGDYAYPDAPHFNFIDKFNSNVEFRKDIFNKLLSSFDELSKTFPRRKIKDIDKYLLNDWGN